MKQQSIVFALVASCLVVPCASAQFTADGYRSKAGTIEVANTVQLKLNAKHRDSYLQLVLLRAPV